MNVSVRLGALLVVFGLLFLSGISTAGDPLRLESRLLASMSGVGMSIGVAPNSENTMAEALYEWDEEIALREAGVVAAERALERDRSAAERQMAYVLAAEAILCFMIALDFMLGRRSAFALRRKNAAFGAGPFS